MTDQKDVTINVKKLIQSKQKQADLEKKLDEASSLATIVIFDLFESTDFRRVHGPRAGLEKAFLHNLTVTEAIESNGGVVAKWMGDGVLGYFTEEKAGDNHPYKALQASVKAIVDLWALNHKLHKTGDEEFHTRVGVSSGVVHFIEEYHSSASLPPNGPFDPMGSTVDLAARLESLADRDVIAIDHETFWGHVAKNENGMEMDALPGVCGESENEILWRRLSLASRRKTDYSPQYAAFFLADNELAASRFAAQGPDPITAEKLKEIAEEECSLKKHKTVVYAAKGIERNAKGFERSVTVFGVCLYPYDAPLQHVPHAQIDTEQMKTALEAGERLFLEERDQEAKADFKAVVANDSRHFLANFRLAQLCYRQGNAEEAAKYLARAEQSIATIPVVWKLGGIIDLESYLQGGQEQSLKLDCAITGFRQGRELAREMQDWRLEQCCATLLAIAYFVRDRETDNAEAVSIRRELDGWVPPTTLMKALFPILKAFEHLRVGGQDRLEHAEKWIRVARSMLEHDDKTRVQRLSECIEKASNALTDGGEDGIEAAKNEIEKGRAISAEDDSTERDAKLFDAAVLKGAALKRLIRQAEHLIGDMKDGL
jgi:class 3 adenylate cyclase/tetratricopeptide (TPR) repeat protein